MDLLSPKSEELISKRSSLARAAVVAEQLLKTVQADRSQWSQAIIASIIKGLTSSSYEPSIAEEESEDELVALVRSALSVLSESDRDAVIAYLKMSLVIEDKTGVLSESHRVGISAVDVLKRVAVATLVGWSLSTKAIRSAVLKAGIGAVKTAARAATPLVRGTSAALGKTGSLIRSMVAGRRSPAGAVKLIPTSKAVTGEIIVRSKPGALSTSTAARAGATQASAGLRGGLSKFGKFAASAGQTVGKGVAKAAPWVWVALMVYDLADMIFGSSKKDRESVLEGPQPSSSDIESIADKLHASSLSYDARCILERGFYVLAEALRETGPLGMTLYSEARAYYEIMNVAKAGVRGGLSEKEAEEEETVRIILFISMIDIGWQLATALDISLTEDEMVIYSKILTDINAKTNGLATIAVAGQENLRLITHSDSYYFDIVDYDEFDLDDMMKKADRRKNHD